MSGVILWLSHLWLNSPKCFFWTYLEVNLQNKELVKNCSFWSIRKYQKSDEMYYFEKEIGRIWFIPNRRSKWQNGDRFGRESLGNRACLQIILASHSKPKYRLFQSLFFGGGVVDCYCERKKSQIRWASP